MTAPLASVVRTPPLLAPAVTIRSVIPRPVAQRLPSITTDVTDVNTVVDAVTNALARVVLAVVPAVLAMLSNMEVPVSTRTRVTGKTFTAAPRLVVQVDAAVNAFPLASPSPKSAIAKDVATAKRNATVVARVVTN